MHFMKSHKSYKVLEIFADVTYYYGDFKID